MRIHVCIHVYVGGGGCMSVCIYLPQVGRGGDEGGKKGEEKKESRIAQARGELRYLVT